MKEGYMESKDVLSVCATVAVVVGGFFFACVKGCEHVTSENIEELKQKAATEKVAMENGYIFDRSGMWVPRDVNYRRKESAH